MHLYLTLLLMICTSAAIAETESFTMDANEHVEQIFIDYKEYCFRNYPTWATYEGDHRYNDRLTDLSNAAVNARYDSITVFLERITAAADDDLTAVNKLNADLFKWMLEREMQDRQFHSHYTPIGQQDGIHIEFPQIITFQPLDSLGHFNDYFARLKAFPKQVDDVIANMRLGMQAGIVQPKFIMEKALQQIAHFSETPAEKLAFMEPLGKPIPAISQKQQAQLKTELEKILNEQVKPAYAKLESFIREEYLPVCREEAGIWALPDGEKRYDYAVKYYTTTSLTPEEIFNIGIQEVERITAEIEKVKNTLGFKGTVKEFFEHVREDKEQQFTEKEEMLEAYRNILRQMDEQLPQFFGKLPRSPYELKEIEAYRAASAPQAYYYSAPEDGSRPGYFYINTHDLPARPKFTMTALALHEAVPGHHLQIAIAKEQKGLPWFRRHLPVTAFVEGWGLYAESLGYEAGLYVDPYQHLGALDFEIWRACRLVVDVGLHHKKWTREQAVQYLLDHSANSEADTRSEVDRYIAWPGQALAYKIGELKIKELRTMAVNALGENFDIRDFHDKILEDGALPLQLLEQKIKTWIDAGAE